jgi:Acyl-coenzyme A:6-aminopenicillanic acid acyl-transferase
LQNVRFKPKYLEQVMMLEKFTRLLLFCAFIAATAVLGPACTTDDGDDDNDSGSSVIEPKREQRGNFTVVWLSGTPYEMGYQQGELMREELIEALDFVNTDETYSLMVPMADSLGFLDLALENSYPEVIEECEGLIDSLEGTGWTMDHCLILNFGDVFVEALPPGLVRTAKKLTPGCSELAAAGAATVDGRLYHGRILDWGEIDYILDYPTIIVRQPNDGLAHAYIGFPGNLSPYSGINEAGVSMASNEADPVDETVQDAVGHSHVQLLGLLLKNASSLEEARQIIEAEDHMSVELFMISDGNALDASVFEMTAAGIGENRLSDGVLWATNHFVGDSTKDLDGEPAGESSLLRYDRLEQLLSPTTDTTYYGEIDPAKMIEIMRDRINPYTGEESTADTFDNNSSLATNGALFQMVFDPENLFFWVAAGGLPIPAQEFYGFSLGELLGWENAQLPEPAIFE